MPRNGARKPGKDGQIYKRRVSVHGRILRSKAAVPAAKLKARQPSTEIREIVRKRAEAEAAVAEARRSHERLREAIDILPQGIVFLDGDGRYILWNKKYSEIYSATSDLFSPGSGSKTRCESAWRAATIRKPRDARRNGSPNGSTSCISRARVMSNGSPMAAAS